MVAAWISPMVLRTAAATVVVPAMASAAITMEISNTRGASGCALSKAVAATEVAAVVMVVVGMLTLY